MGSVNKIESFGLVDGPGIRCVVFLNGCKLRCKYCHNPEMWTLGKDNMTPKDLLQKVRKFKPYFKDTGGVTFSGGECLLQEDFLIDTMKLLKKDNIHIAIDTSGVGNGSYEKILKYVDLVILDIKYADKDGYQKLTGTDIDESEKFIKALNKSNKEVWLRQVIIPGLNDNHDYLVKLKKYISKIKNVKRIDFLPYHTMGTEKYKKLDIKYPLEGVPSMDKEKCNELYEEFLKIENS